MNDHDRFSTEDRGLHDASFGELFKKLSPRRRS